MPDVAGNLRLIGLLDSFLYDTSGADVSLQSPAYLIAPPWREIFQIDAERKQSFEEAQATYEAMIETYSGLGCFEEAQATYEAMIETYSALLRIDSTASRLYSGARELFAGSYRECLLTSHGLMCSIMETSLLFGASRNFMQSG